MNYGIPSSRHLLAGSVRSSGVKMLAASLHEETAGGRTGRMIDANITS